MKIKRIISIILLSCMLIATFSLMSCSEGDGAPDGYQLVARNGDKFRLYVPTQGWTPNTEGGVTSAIFSMEPHISVGVYVADDAEGMTVEQYWAHSEENMKAELENYQFVGKEEEMLGGKKATRYVYTADLEARGKEEPVKYRYLTILCENGDELYVFIYCAPDEVHYEANLPDVEGIIEVFAFDEAYKGSEVGETPSGVEIPEGMKLASFDEHPYLFFVPESWVINDGSVISAAYFSEEDRSNVSLQMYMVSEKEIDKTVEEYFAECEERYKKVFSSYTLLEEECGEIEMAGSKKARRYVYEIENGGVKYKQLQAIVVKGGVFYTLTYTATPENFDGHLADVEKMIEAFKIR